MPSLKPSRMVRPPQRAGRQIRREGQRLRMNTVYSSSRVRPDVNEHDRTPYPHTSQIWIITAAAAVGLGHRRTHRFTDHATVHVHTVEHCNGNDWPTTCVATAIARMGANA